jgi:uncharacterized phosphosugar-binding protein
MDLADVIIDNCVPPGDALISIAGWDDPVGPASTVAMGAITNAIKCSVASQLAERGVKLPVITSSVLIGSEASTQRFDDAYDEYRRRMVRAYGGRAE